MAVTAATLQVRDSTSGQKIAEGDPRAGIVSIDPDRMSGTPCFAGSRVPIANLWHYLVGGDTLDEFLEDFEGVSRDQAIGALELALARLLNEPRAQ